MVGPCCAGTQRMYLLSIQLVYLSVLGIWTTKQLVFAKYFVISLKSLSQGKYKQFILLL